MPPKVELFVEVTHVRGDFRDSSHHGHYPLGLELAHVLASEDGRDGQVLQVIIEHDRRVPPRERRANAASPIRGVRLSPDSQPAS